MPAEPTAHEGPASPEDDPIAELQSPIQSHAGNVAKRFDPALTIFAGSSAATKNPKHKLAELEQMIPR
jgi:hypothetical protein